MLHLKHHDVLVNFLLHLLQALNWFNPFVYWLCRIIRNDSEALCDQRALEKLRGEEKREYGMLLLDMADSRCASRIGTTSMANGARNIKTRIGRIADFGRVPKGQPLQRRVLRWCFALLRSALPISRTILIPPRWKRRRICG